MKRPIVVVGLLLAVLAALVVLVADPWSWLVPDRSDAALARRDAPDAGLVARPDLARPAELAPANDRAAPSPDPTSTPERSTAAQPPTLAVFTLLTTADHPVPNAQLLLVRDRALLADRSTDSDGTVAFDADGRPAELFLAVAHRPLERRDVVLDATPHTLHLSDGARLSARFLRDDGGAPAALSVVVESDAALSPGPPPPAAVEAALAVPVLKNFVALTTDANAALELAGLPATWTGRLTPRGPWKVVSASQGELDPLSGGVRLSRPATDLVLRLVPRGNLHGRLVLRDGGEPMVGAQLLAVLRAPGSDERDGVGARTGADGRFELQVRMETIGRFELHLGGVSKTRSALLALDGAALPADGDLGDVLVDGARNVSFVLQDPAQRPIAGGVAVAGVARSTPTKEDGRGELLWLPRDVRSMAVEAAGFAPLEVELPPVVAAPLVVTLQPANELAVRLKLPEGASPRNFKVVLRGAGASAGERAGNGEGAPRGERARDASSAARGGRGSGTEGEPRGAECITVKPITRDLGDRAHVSTWTYPPFELRDAELGTYLCAQPSEPDAEVAFRALRPGVELDLEVHGLTGDAVYHRERVAPLAPSEHRSLEIALSGALVIFRGRVVGSDGTALVRASLQLDNQILGWTDARGEFVCVLDGPRTGTLLVSHRACATKYLRDYAVPTDGAPVEFRLSTARYVRVEVVDERGAPMPEAEVWVEYQGFTTNTHRIEGHRHLAQSVPETRFTLRAHLAGRDYRQEHEPDVPEARIVVPVHGRVTAQVSAATTATRGGTFVLHLKPPEGVDAEALEEARASAAGLRIPVSAVCPGRYRASLRYVPTEEEQRAGRAVETSEVVPVEVEAGGESVVQLGLKGGG